MNRWAIFSRALKRTSRALPGTFRGPFKSLSIWKRVGRRLSAEVRLNPHAQPFSQREKGVKPLLLTVEFDPTRGNFIGQPYLRIAFIESHTVGCGIEREHLENDHLLTLASSD